MINFERFNPKKNLEQIEAILTELEGQADLDPEKLQQAEKDINRLSSNCNPQTLEKEFGERMKKIFSKQEIEA